MTAEWSGPTDTELAPGVATACTGVALTREAVPAGAVECDGQLIRILEQFTERSRKDLDSIDGRLRERLGGYREFILWGMGELSMKLLAQTVLAELDPVALVDGNAARQGAQYRGEPVVSPDAIRRDDVPIVIGSLIRDEPIISAIAARQLPNPVVPLR
jgi:hypothetical protein